MAVGMVVEEAVRKAVENVVGEGSTSDVGSDRGRERPLAHMELDVAGWQAASGEFSRAARGMSPSLPGLSAPPVETS